MKTSACAVFLGLAVLFAGTRATAGDAFADLLKRVPSDANAILAIDVPALHNSQLGQRENWAKKHQQDYLDHVTRIPPTVTRVLIGAQLNPSTLETNWRVGLLDSKLSLNPDAMARSVGGVVDQIGGESVVVTPQNSFLTSLTPQLVGVRSPVNRQEMARWLRFAKQNSRPVVSPYLQEAASSTSNLAPAIMAVDLTDIFDLEGMQKCLKGSPALAGQPAAAESAARLLAGIKGATCTMRVGNALTGELRLDFSAPAQPMANVAKPLILQAIDSMGLHIEDLEKWQVQTKGNSTYISGPITMSGARQLFSPLLGLGHSMALEQHQESPGQPATAKLEQSPAVASQRYFRSVYTLMTELDSHKAKTFNQLAGWYAQYAAKIDNLPMLHVDPDLLNYGAQVSATLRGLSNNSRAALSAQQYQKMNAVEAVVPITYNYTGYAGGSYGNPYYGGGAGWGYNYSLPGVAQVNNYGTINNLMAQTSGAEGSIRQATMKNLADATSAIRRKMTEKYQVEF